MNIELQTIAANKIVDELLEATVAIDLGMEFSVTDMLKHANALMTLAAEAVSIHDLEIEGLSDSGQNIVRLPLLWALNSMVRSNKTQNPLEALNHAFEEIEALEAFLAERSKGAVTFELSDSAKEALQWFYHFDWVSRLDEIKELSWLFSTDIGSVFMLRSDLRERLAQLRELPVESSYTSFEAFLSKNASL